MGKALMSRAQQRYGEHCGSGQRQSDAYQTGHLMGCLIHLRMGLVQLLQDALRMPVQRTSRRRRHDTLPAPKQQLGAEISLQRRDLLTQRGLGNAERVRGSGQAARVDHANERFQAPGFHVQFPPSAISIHYSAVVDGYFHARRENGNVTPG